MRILLGCEESQAVCIEFRELGHEAYSCDTEDCSGGHPEWHIKGDVRDAIRGGYLKTQSGQIILIKKWDLGIFFPPCTRLTNSVWWYIVKNNLHEDVKQASDFFNLLLHSNIQYVAVENPIHSKGANLYIRKQDQIIQPYNFNDDASKATCLWLKNLPPLQNTGFYEPRIVDGKRRWGNQTDGGWNKLGPSPDRAKLRSKTFPGIAKAMATQWHETLVNSNFVIPVQDMLDQLWPADLM